MQQWKAQKGAEQKYWPVLRIEAVAMDKGLPFSLLGREVQAQIFLIRKFTL